MADAPKPNDQTPDTNVSAATPGMTITPAGAPRPVEERTSTLDLPVQAPAPPAPIVPPTPALTPIPQPEPVPATIVATPTLTPQTPLQEPAQGVSTTEDGSIVWTASEFIAHEKSTRWYGTLAAVAVLAAGLILILAKDIISTIVVLVCAFAFGFYASRQPRQLQYIANEHGIGVGEKFYPYESFRFFTIVPDGAFSSIIFMPLKRFAVTTTIYYAPEDEDKIVDLLADRLPYEEHTPDAVDRLMRRIRF